MYIIIRFSTQIWQHLSVIKVSELYITIINLQKLEIILFFLEEEDRASTVALHLTVLCNPLD